jgi:succinoglycan biosynthesis protein ExoV
VILYRWQGASSNFGDELNTVLWPRLLPDFFDCDSTVRFLGIGSILDQRHPPQAIKLVAGAGYGGYERKPHLDETWTIHWVRGPRTAATLGLPPRLALGDPAALVPGAIDVPTVDGHDIGFMPHFESAAQGAWRAAAELAGVRLIDPRDPPLVVLQAIGCCKLLLSEALHGVIVADALRVPWIAIRPRARVHRPKWLDWADTMDLRPRFQPLPASTLAEWTGTSHLGVLYPAKVWLGRQELRLDPGIPERLIARAGQALRLAASAPPQLSTDTALHRCQSRMLDAIHGIGATPFRATSIHTVTAHRRSCLQASDVSAYQLTPIG